MNKRKLQNLSLHEKKRLYARYNFLLALSNNEHFGKMNPRRLLTRVRRYWNALSEQERSFIVYERYVKERAERLYNKC